MTMKEVIKNNKHSFLNKTFLLNKPDLRINISVQLTTLIITTINN